MKSYLTSLFIIVSFFLIQVAVWPSKASLKVSPSALSLLVGSNATLEILFDEPLQESATLYFSEDTDGIIDHLETVWVKPTRENQIWNLDIFGKQVGKVTVHCNVTPSFNSTSFVNVHVTVIYSNVLWWMIDIFGWIYFVTFGVAYYPQFIKNFRRRSVTGYSFDYLIMNLTGFLSHGLFNYGMYWIPEIKNEYLKLNPGGVNPVLLTDIAHSLHGTIIIGLTGIQCYIYERGDQKVQKSTWGILGGILVYLGIGILLVCATFITWLDWLYLTSFINVFITISKYIPQAYLNYRRKSTDGWSIGFVFFDMTGSIFLVAQMFLIACNNNDWASISGNPTKFLLGTVTIIFDTIFLLQHFVWYREIKIYKSNDTRKPSLKVLLVVVDGCKHQNIVISSPSIAEETDAPPSFVYSPYITGSKCLNSMCQEKMVSPCMV